MIEITSEEIENASHCITDGVCNNERDSTYFIKGAKWAINQFPKLRFDWRQYGTSGWWFMEVGDLGNYLVWENSYGFFWSRPGQSSVKVGNIEEAKKLAEEDCERRVKNLFK